MTVAFLINMERTPETLQKLCIYYCSEHLAYLNLNSEGNVQPICDGSPTDIDVCLSSDLCYKLLKQYLNSFIHCNKKAPQIDLVLNSLLKKASVHEMHLSLLRRGLVSDSVLQGMSSCHIVSLDLFVCKDLTLDDKNIEVLFRKNKLIMKNLKICGELGVSMLVDETKYAPDLNNPVVTAQTCPVAKKMKVLSNPEETSSNDVSVEQLSLRERSDASKATQKHLASDNDMENDGNNDCNEDIKRLKETNWFKFPNMQSVTLVNTDIWQKKQSEFIIERFFASNPQLIAACIAGIDAHYWLPKVASLRNLTSLSLSSRTHFQNDGTFSFKCLDNLENLRHLDISNAVAAVYTNEDIEQFVKYVRSATKLVSLEIGGTNLSMIVGHHKNCAKNLEFREDDCLDCLAPLEQRRFQYLGLVNCPHEPYNHRFIPADKVSGFNGEMQTLTALWSYQHNPGLLIYVLDYMADSDVPEEKNMQTFINALLAFLEQYQDWSMSPDDTQSIFETTKKVVLQLYRMLRIQPERRKANITQNRHILERMLILIDNCQRDIKVDENNDSYPGLEHVVMLSLAILERLQQPQNAIYCYMLDKYISTLICVVEGDSSLDVKVWALILLDNVCGMYDQDLDIRLGEELGLIKILLFRIEASIYNYPGNQEYFTLLWRILWKLSDECPTNCVKFMENGGIEISMKFIEVYPDEFKVHKAIAALLRNVAEVPQLRPGLCQKELVLMMRKLLESASGKPEKEACDVTAQVTAFLVMLAADGPNAWKIQSPSRDLIMEDVEKTIDTWKTDRYRGTVYKCLRPVLRYMAHSDTPAAQYWACWEICNLLTLSPSTYISMFKEEGGLEVIHRMKTESSIKRNAKRLVDTIVEMIEKSKEPIDQGNRE